MKINKEHEYFMKVIIYEDQLPVDFTREDHRKFPTYEMHCYSLKELFLKVNFRPAADYTIKDFSKLVEEKIRQEFNVFQIVYVKPMADMKIEQNDKK